MKPTHQDNQLMNDIKCRRVYPNGDTILELRNRSAVSSPCLQGWLEFNRLHRPGTTLLVDGKVDTIGIGHRESDKERLEMLYDADKPRSNLTTDGSNP